MADSTGTYAPSRVFRGQDGALYLNNGAVYSSGGTNIAPFLANIVQSSAAGVKFVSSTGKLTTANPTAVVTGLGAVRVAFAQINSSVAPSTVAGGPHVLTVVNTATAGKINIYQWGPASTANAGFTDGTSSANYSWFAIGTS